MHVRVARPVSDLRRAQRMYCDGLGLAVLDTFEDHEGFDGLMLGMPGAGWHLEFTRSRRHPVAPTPTPEDMVVLYLPAREAWQAASARMLDAGFRRLPAYNPYWERNGRTFADADGYRVVLQNARWATG